MLTRVPARRLALRRLHARTGVERRHLALPLSEYEGLTSFGTANDAFIRVGADLAERACVRALAEAGLTAADVDLILVTTVTGVAVPSLDAILVGRLGLRGDVRRLPLFGFGCAGGAAGLARVDDYLTGHPRAVALLVSVELCSLTVQHGDDTIANLVSSGLFGDGASAVVLVGDQHAAAESASAEIVATRSRLFPGTVGELGWHVGDGGLRVILSPGLPNLIRAHLLGEAKALLAEHDLTIEQVPVWVVHAGGPRVIDAVRDALDLAEADVRFARQSLAEEGNLSSSSVLHILARTLRAGDYAPGDPALLMAFGPGVSAELVLLRLGEAGRSAGVAGGEGAAVGEIADGVEGAERPVSAS